MSIEQRLRQIEKGLNMKNGSIRSFWDYTDTELTLRIDYFLRTGDPDNIKHVRLVELLNTARARKTERSN